MTSRCFLGLGAALMVAGLAGAAHAAPPSWQGEWHLNTAESKYPPGFPPIHDHVMKVMKDDGKALQYTDSFAIGDQPPTHVSFDGAFDGKPYKTSDGQDMAFFHTDTGYRDVWTAPNGTKGEDSCDFSGNGARLTCHGQFTPPGAKAPVTFVEVWDKAG
jgi:hypothetical protein